MSRKAAIDHEIRAACDLAHSLLERDSPMLQIGPDQAWLEDTERLCDCVIRLERLRREERE